MSMCILCVPVWVALPRRWPPRGSINGLTMRTLPCAFSRILIEEIPCAFVGFCHEPLLTRRVYNLGRDSATMLSAASAGPSGVEHFRLMISMGELVLLVLEKFCGGHPSLRDPIGNLPARGFSIVVPVERLSFVLGRVPSRGQVDRGGRLHRRRFCSSRFRSRPS